MQPAYRGALRGGVASVRSSWICSSRSISLTGAIERGKRQSHQNPDRQAAVNRRPRNQSDVTTTGPDEEALREAPNWLHKSVRVALVDEHVPAPSIMGPTQIPYTTASSVFLYGSNAVLAALSAQRRKFYKLYLLLPADAPHEVSEEHSIIHKLAEEAGVQIEKVSGNRWKILFTKVSDGHPHNNVVLEASVLPQLPVTSLSKVHSAEAEIVARTGWMYEEDRELNRVFDVTRDMAFLPSVRPSHRYPFMLMLDRITNIGNIGAIIRSAWFLGVDAIILLEHGTAPINNVTVAASAGAAEYMPILRVGGEKAFIKDSKLHGWKFFGALAPDAVKPAVEATSRTDYTPIWSDAQSKQTPNLQAKGVLLDHPCVLILGNGKFSQTSCRAEDA